MKTKLLLAAFALVGLLALALSVQRVPQPSRFCDECVMREDVTEWRLAGRWTLFKTENVNATPVSELLAEHHACPVHEHKWSAPTYVAEADLETGEAPRVRSVGFLNEPRTVNFLREMMAYTDHECVTNWRAVAWQPTLAAALEPALRFRRFPEEGFANRGDFLVWWNESAYPLFNKLNEMTVAD
jgi:hypothetical protein